MRDLFEQFITMVRDLCKPGQKILDSLTATGVHLLHMAVGAIGEVAELREAADTMDRANIVEELGDYEFYLTGIYQGVGSDAPLDTAFEPHTKYLMSADTLCNTLLLRTGTLLDKIKRLTIYNKPITDDEVLSLAERCSQALAQFYASNTFNITRDEVREHNMNKLLKGDKARYASGTYSDDQANARADKAEPVKQVNTNEPYLDRSESQVEADLQAKGLNAPRLQPSDIDGVIYGIAYHVFPETTVTICCLTLANGFNVTGESACASIENFDYDEGKKIAFQNARNKIWLLEGYLLKSKLSGGKV